MLTHCTSRVQFYYECGNVEELSTAHRRLFKVYHYQLYPTHIPSPDFYWGPPTMQGISRSSIHSTPARIRSSRAQTTVGWRLHLEFMQGRDETVIAFTGLKKEREARGRAREWAMTPEERREEWLKDFAAYRAKEERKDTPMSELLFVKELPDHLWGIDWSKSYVDWDSTIIFRPVNADEVVKNSIRGVRSKLPCGHAFHNDCCVPFLEDDYDGCDPHCLHKEDGCKGE